MDAKFTITLTLNRKEVEGLRNSTSDLGNEYIQLRLEIANALLDAGYTKTCDKDWM